MRGRKERKKNHVQYQFPAPWIYFTTYVKCKIDLRLKELSNLIRRLCIVRSKGGARQHSALHGNTMHCKATQCTARQHSALHGYCAAYTYRGHREQWRVHDGQCTVRNDKKLCVCNAIQYNIIRMWCSSVQCSAVLYNAVRCGTVQYSAVQCSTV